MPVILERAAEQTWHESDDEDELVELLDPSSAAFTEACPISRKANDPGYESPDVTNRVDIGNQSELEESG